MIRFRAVASGDFQTHGGRTILFEPRTDGGADVRGVLVWHEAAGDFRARAQAGTMVLLPSP